MEKDKEELFEEYKTRNRYLIYLKESEDEHKDELIKREKWEFYNGLRF